jgi:ATP-binding cassette subfamily B protein
MKKTGLIKNNFYLFKLILSHSRWLLPGKLIFALLAAIRNVLTSVVITKYIITVVIQKRNLDEILYVLGLYILYIGITLVANSIFDNCYVPIGTENLKFDLLSRLHNKMASIDLRRYDEPDFYNDFIWTMSSIENRIDGFIKNIERLVRDFGSLVLALSLFAVIDYSLFIIIIIITGVIVAMNPHLANISHEKTIAIQPMVRKSDYISRIFKSYSYAKELRVSNIHSLFESIYDKNDESLVNLLKKKNKIIFCMNFFQIYLSGYFSVYFLMVLFLGYRALVTKTIDVGDFVAAFNSVNIIMGSVLFLLGNFVRRLEEDNLFAERYKKIMSEEAKIKDGPLNLFQNPIGFVQVHEKTDQKSDYFVNSKEAIPKTKVLKQPPLSIPGDDFLLSVKDVSFSYSDLEIKPVLQNISFELHKNKKIAIVGHNGAGKTTLIKLLMRLYDVSGGAIYLNGNDIRMYNLQEYRNLFGTIFQDFQIYATSIAENISMDNKYDREKIDDSIRLSGFDEKVNQLKDGIETELLREYNDKGVLLSGGENQKMAIARALYPSKAKIVIMDEPSSALDPVAESQFYNRVVDNIQEKALLIISHRLSTTMMADTIIVIDAGKIIEEGSHNELLNLNGKYAEMWNYQSKKYLKE